jgi:hypothetical protein
MHDSENKLRNPWQLELSMAQLAMNILNMIFPMDGVG